LTSQRISHQPADASSIKQATPFQLASGAKNDGGFLDALKIQET
jgi:hypothetical protein